MYAEPRRISDPESCFWYHTMDLPGFGTTPGSWDLRPTIGDYLGQVDLAGLRCLDVGAASGHLSFEMERCGAREVVSVDTLTGGDLDALVPFADPRFDLNAKRREMDEIHDALVNSYWFAHRALGSRARVWYGNAYDLPPELGRFDVAVIGMMLPHTRDPLRILERVGALADRIVVTQPSLEETREMAYFMPDPDTLNPWWAWWSMSDACLERMLRIVGFRVEERIVAEHACPGRRDRHEPGAYQGRTERCTTTVAARHR